MSVEFLTCLLSRAVLLKLSCFIKDGFEFLSCFPIQDLLDEQKDIRKYALFLDTTVKSK